MAKQKNKIPRSLSWEAYEFKYHPKSTGWFIGFVLISSASLVYAFFRGSVITLITFALLVITTYFYAVRKPRTLRYQIDEKGVSVGKLFYPYQTLKNFWIIYNPPYTKTVNFETTTYLNRIVKLELDQQDPVEIQFILNQYLPEDVEKKESVSDILMRKTKF